LKIKKDYIERISSWKIQKVIEKYRLYYHPQKTAKIAKKRQRAIKKKRITELQKKNKTGFLICLDVIVIYWQGLKRYIFTAIDYYSKLALALMYKSKSSLNAQDFIISTLDDFMNLWAIKHPLNLPVEIPKLSKMYSSDTEIVQVQIHMIHLLSL